MTGSKLDTPPFLYLTTFDTKKKWSSVSPGNYYSKGLFSSSCWIRNCVDFTWTQLCFNSVVVVGRLRMHPRNRTIFVTSMVSVPSEIMRVLVQWWASRYVFCLCIPCLTELMCVTVHHYACHGQATPCGLTYTQPLTIPNRLFTSTLSNKRAVSTDLFEARGNQIGRKLVFVIWLGTKCGRTRGKASSSDYAHKKKRLRLYTFQFRSRSLLELPTSRKSRVRRQKVRFLVNPKYVF